MNLLRFLILAAILLTAGLAHAFDVSFTDDVDIDLGNGVYLRILAIQNASNDTDPVWRVYNSTDSPPNTWELWMNASRLRFNASANLTLYNISMNNVTDTLSFITYGAGGQLNFSAVMLNASANYYFKSDGMFVKALASDGNKEISSNRTVSGTHTFAFAPRNITYTTETANPNQVVVFNTITLSLDITDNDGGTISSAIVQVQKPGGTTNYTMTKGVGNAFALAFSDTGTAGTYSIIRYYATDSDGLQYTSPASSLTFSITATTAGGSSGGGGGGGGGGGNQSIPDLLAGLLPNATKVLESLIPAAQNPVLLPQAPSINLLTLMNDPAGMVFLKLMLAAGVGLLAFWTGLPRVVVGIGKNKMSNSWFYLAGIMIVVPLYALGYASDVIDPKAVIGVIVVMFAAVFILKS